MNLLQMENHTSTWCISAIFVAREGNLLAALSFMKDLDMKIEFVNNSITG